MTNRRADRACAAWFEGARLVLHLDLHTGLGDFGTHKLLVDDQRPGRNLEMLPADIWRRSGRGWRSRSDQLSRARALRPLGDRLGLETRRRYLYACAEFGNLRQHRHACRAPRRESGASLGAPDDPRAERREPSSAACSARRHRVAPTGSRWWTRARQERRRRLGAGASVRPAPDRHASSVAPVDKLSVVLDVAVLALRR